MVLLTYIRRACNIFFDCQYVSFTRKSYATNYGISKAESMISDTIRDPKLNEEHSLVQGPKKKVAMLVAYCGKNYHGVMMNRGDRSYPTIEKELITALVRAKLIPTYCWDSPYAMRFVIASRTDKGVSACGQVFSLKMQIHPEAIALINNQLPKDIKVIALERVTRGFSAWRFSCWRSYSYTLPTYAFADAGSVSEDYRITEDKFRHIRSIAYRYKGIHTFHNFTSGIEMGEPQAQRRIIEFDIEKPFVHDSIEFVTLRIKGQSFILHQIRMMVGLMISIVSGRAGEDYFVRAFSETSLEIPLAPGSGLLLEKISYEGYNKHFSRTHASLDFSDYREKADSFYRTEILPTVLRQETEEKSMLGFLDYLDCLDFSMREVEEVDITNTEPDCEALVEILDDSVEKKQSCLMQSYERDIENESSLNNHNEQFSMQQIKS